MRAELQRIADRAAKIEAASDSHTLTDAEAAQLHALRQKQAAVQGVVDALNQQPD